MIETKTYPMRWYDSLLAYFFRFAASGVIPASWFRDAIVPVNQRKAASGVIELEIVSHCWQYSNLLAYQLSSLVNYPPTKAKVTMTVFYSPEDLEAEKLLHFFSEKKVENITWNWQALDKQKVFRRAIGRNRAALSSKADWLWFTDCDVIFHKNCIDEIAGAVQGRTDALVYPKQERITAMLADSDPMLRKGCEPQLVDIQGDDFSIHKVTRATGPLQIVHGDVARALGYCAKVPLYQTPSDRWRKTYEDSGFRWLLGTEGEPLDVGGSFRIRHVHKGRYRKDSFWSKIRSKIRQAQEY